MIQYFISSLADYTAVIFLELRLLKVAHNGFVTLCTHNEIVLEVCMHSKENVRVLCYFNIGGEFSRILNTIRQTGNTYMYFGTIPGCNIECSAVSLQHL